MTDKANVAASVAASLRFEPYPAYKDSDIEWLGKIPGHWDTARMWRISTAASGGTPSKDESTYWDGSIPWVSPKDMKRRFLDSSEDTVTERAIAETGIKLVEPPGHHQPGHEGAPLPARHESQLHGVAV